jgi:NAD(P)-dependent dehydrogenase (short-subunit alcohol dehydrogenase family)
MNRLKGKIAWITGAGTGIGQGIALALAGKGASLILSGRRPEPLEEAAAKARDLGVQVLVAPLDVTDRQTVDRTARDAAEELGVIDLLVNNAGMNTRKRMAIDMEPQDWDRVVEVNLTGAFNCFRAVFPDMKAKGEGLIINISSMAGKQTGLLGGAAYSASKHGMVSLTHSINLEAAEYGVRASVICPGEVDTPLIAARPEPVSARRQALMLKPEDLGEAVVFVAGMPPHVTIPELWILPTYQVSGRPLP